jgi:PAS domain-containing protein
MPTGTNVISRVRNTKLSLSWRIWLAPALLLLGLACTVVAYAAARDAAEQSEQRVLEQRANEFSGLVTAALRNTQAVLEASGAIAEATDGDRDALATMEQRVGRSALTSLVVIHADSAAFRRTAQLGRLEPILLERLPALDGRLREVARTGRFRVVGAALSQGNRVIGVASAAQPNSRFVAYGEITVPQVVQTDGSPEGLLYAIYLGAEPSREGLLASNVREFPAEVSRTTRTLALGDEKLSVVVAARSLGASGTSSWLILLLGGLGSIVLAAFLEMRRRRRAAVRSVDELREQSDQLQALMAEQRRIEADLRTSEERYRLLVELSPDMIAMQTDGRIVYVNQKGVELLGASSPDDLIG